MELADKFLELKSIKPSVFYVWGHSYEFEDDNNWYVIEDFCNKMTGKDDIWYCTNMELYTAWLDYTRLESTADGHNIYNPGLRSVWVCDKKKNVYEIPSGQTVFIP